MRMYVDSECRCHTTNPNDIYTEIEAPEQLEDKCTTYIEGFRVRPEGYTYTRDDGEVFGPDGSSVTPWKPYDRLAAAQAQYEADLAEAAKAYQEGVDSVWT